MQSRIEKERMNTRKYPRTLNEAFGPYTSREFNEPREYSRGFIVAYAVTAVMALLVIGATL